MTALTAGSVLLSASSRAWVGRRRGGQSTYLGLRRRLDCNAILWNRRKRKSEPNCSAATARPCGILQDRTLVLPSRTPSVPAPHFPHLSKTLKGYAAAAANSCSAPLTLPETRGFASFCLFPAFPTTKPQRPTPPAQGSSPAPGRPPAAKGRAWSWSTPGPHPGAWRGRAAPEGRFWALGTYSSDTVPPNGTSPSHIQRRRWLHTEFGCARLRVLLLLLALPAAAPATDIPLPRSEANAQGTGCCNHKQSLLQPCSLQGAAYLRVLKYQK